MKTLLSLDMSTTCTGWSLFELDAHNLVSYGILKGKTFKDSSSQRATLKKLEKMAEDINGLILNYKPTFIVIEEIAGSKNRIGQKTLDMLHGIVWKCIEPYLDIVSYYDVGGENGWRTHLQLRLSDADKINNKESKKLNLKIGRGVTKLPIIGWKDLSCRYVNRAYGLVLDPQVNQFDADIGDSIAMGSAWIKFKFTGKFR